MSATLVDMGKHDRRPTRTRLLGVHVGAPDGALPDGVPPRRRPRRRRGPAPDGVRQAYLSWDRIRDREALDGYVRRIMVNENNSLWRRRGSAASTRPTHSRDRRGTTCTTTAWAGRLVVRQTLPPKQRSVVVLRYYEQLSEAEIADVLGSPSGP